jgi:hypothetical protein
MAIYLIQTEQLQTLWIPNLVPRPSMESLAAARLRFPSTGPILGPGGESLTGVWR